MTEDPAAFAKALDTALTTAPQPRPRPAGPAGERVGVCNGQSGVRFSGPTGAWRSATAAT